MQIENIKIIMVGTTHSGNIGAAARAMHNMSLRQLVLVSPELDPGQLAGRLHGLSPASHAAVVFGREHSGLTNEEIQMCHTMLRIPTNPDFSSLNVASAIQVTCYEIYRQWLAPDEARDNVTEPLAGSAELEGYFDHLQRVLQGIEFLNPEQPGQIMQRLRRLYLRSEVTRNEVNILRGILSAVEKKRDF
jgi:tRNA (cytidine32/uridine32-2'-O)-methyltransferase